MFSFLKRLFKKKKRDDSIISARLKCAFKKASVLSEIEKILIEADMGAELAVDLLEEIGREDRLRDYEGFKAKLIEKLSKILEGSEKELELTGNSIVVLFGVNGCGKTTSVAKICNYLLGRGRNPALVAADTFRAAAIEQLTLWAERLNVRIYSQKEGADSGAVIWDAISSFKLKKDLDTLIIDTGGRLHNDQNLINQFTKILKVIEKQSEGIQKRFILVIDGTTGQNALKQIEIFSKCCSIDGLLITKLDGTAKGGILIQAYQKYKIPVMFTGIGEKFTDLAEYSINGYLDRIL